MATDVLSETQRSQANREPQGSPGARWWKRGLLAFAAVAVLAIAATFYPGAISPHESGSTLTHTISRSDLISLARNSVSSTTYHLKKITSLLLIR